MGARFGPRASDQTKNAASSPRRSTAAPAESQAASGARRPGCPAVGAGFVRPARGGARSVAATAAAAASSGSSRFRAVASSWRHRDADKGSSAAGSRVSSASSWWQAATSARWMSDSTHTRSNASSRSAASVLSRNSAAVLGSSARPRPAGAGAESDGRAITSLTRSTRAGATPLASTFSPSSAWSSGPRSPSIHASRVLTVNRMNVPPLRRVAFRGGFRAGIFSGEKPAGRAIQEGPASVPVVAFGAGRFRADT